MSKLDSVLKTAKELIAFRATIGDVIAQTTAEIKATNRQLVEARHSLAREEADGALGKLVPAKQGSAAASIRKLQEKLESLQARIIGLEASRSETDAEVLSAESAVSEALSADSRARMDAFYAEYCEAAERFVQTLRKGKALSEAIGTPFGGLEQVKLLHPYDMRVSVASIVKNELLPGTMQWTEVPIRSKSDEKLYAEVAGMRAVSTALRDQVNRIRESRHAEEQARLTTAREELLQAGPPVKSIQTAYLPVKPAAS